MSRHYIARTDEEEELALSLALAASLADAGPPLPPPARLPSSGASPERSAAQPATPASSPAAPGWLPRQPAGSSSNSSKQPFWSRPLQLLDSALQKAADSVQQAAAAAAAAGAAPGAAAAAPGLGGPAASSSSSSSSICSRGGCGGCGRALGFGAAVQALGRTWHPGCFRCAGCGQVLASGGLQQATFAVGADSLPYHPDCHRQLHHPRCCVCSQPLPATPDGGAVEWRESQFWRDRFCPSHSSDGTPHCCSCSRLRPRGEEWATLADGRELCLRCLDSLVVDTRDAQGLYDEVLGFFAAMGLPHAYKVPLLLVEGGVLEEHANREGRPQGAGPVFHIRGLCVAHVYTTIPSVVRQLAGAVGVRSVATSLLAPQQTCSVSVLLVLYGLPRLLIGSIVAHELMHAYLRMRHVTGLPLQVEEGLCQLLAHLWLDSQDAWAKGAGPYQERLLSYLSFQIRTDSSDVYGEGFRTALAGFQQRGLRTLVEHAVAARAWPDWRE